MSKEQLIARLREIGMRQIGVRGRVKGRDEERDHVDADGALIDYINDPEITAAYEAITKWYA